MPLSAPHCLFLWRSIARQHCVRRYRRAHHHRRAIASPARKRLWREKSACARLRLFLPDRSSSVRSTYPSPVLWIALSPLLRARDLRHRFSLPGITCMLQRRGKHGANWFCRTGLDVLPQKDGSSHTLQTSRLHAAFRLVRACHTPAGLGFAFGWIPLFYAVQLTYAWFFPTVPLYTGSLVLQPL